MPGWKVWGELARRSHLELAWAILRGHRGRIDDIGDGRRLITLDARLDQCNRRAVLAHELVHDERILYTDDIPIAVWRKEEAWVVAETCRRLVPLDELDELVRRAVLNDDGVSWRDVATAFDVPRDVAENAFAQLQNRSRRRHPSTPSR